MLIFCNFYSYEKYSLINHSIIISNSKKKYLYNIVNTEVIFLFHFTKFKYFIKSLFEI